MAGSSGFRAESLAATSSTPAKRPKLARSTEEEEEELEPSQRHSTKRRRKFVFAAETPPIFQGIEKARPKLKQRVNLAYGSRRWAVSSRDCSNFKDKVVVVSYNILGAQIAFKHRYLYRNVSHKCLEWEWRKKRICEEIKSYDPNILCFQEVDQFNDLSISLQKDGFKGVHKARTGEACDGCSIFWKDEVFTLLHHEFIEFKSFGLRDNVAQFCVLQTNQFHSQSDVNIPTSGTPNTRSLVVGNIHLLFNPKRGDIKLGQIRLFLEKAHKLSEEWGKIPIVLGGDLNSLPKSAMYQFLSSSELDIQIHDRRKISGQEINSSRSRRNLISITEPLIGGDPQSICRTLTSIPEPLMCGDPQSICRNPTSIPEPLMGGWSSEEVSLATGCEGVTHLKHRLNLCSAYAAIPGSSSSRDELGEPLATSYNSEFMGTVDYIWHTEELVPIKVLETLPLDTLRRIGGLPSKEWGSDHLALVCELAFSDESNN